MEKHFYSHIIEIDSIYIELDLLDMSQTEREHLTKILESAIHHAVIDTILSELKDDHKKTFLIHVAAADHEKTWLLINQNIPHAEKKISRSVNKLKTQLKKDIKRAKKQ